METLRYSTGRAKRLKTAASVHAQDLRGFLQLLEDEGELATITSPVALNQEIGAVCLRNLRAKGPGLLFERPAASRQSWPRNGTAGPKTCFLPCWSRTGCVSKMYQWAIRWT